MLTCLALAVFKWRGIDAANYRLLQGCTAVVFLIVGPLALALRRPRIIEKVFCSLLGNERVQDVWQVIATRCRMAASVCSGLVSPYSAAIIVFLTDLILQAKWKFQFIRERKLVAGAYEARVVEAGFVAADFQAEDEDTYGTFPYTRVRFYADGIALTYQEVINRMSSDSPDCELLRSLHANVLAGSGELVPFREYFWECLPVSQNTLNTTVYEFVAINAPEMARKTVDVHAFADKFVGHTDSMDVLQFITPAKPPRETNLIVPARALGTELDVYRSCGSFFRGAPLEQQHTMLRMLANHVPARMKAIENPSAPLWISTAGYDVAWIHMRLDNFPKYYRFKEYKNAMPAP